MPRDTDIEKMSQYRINKLLKNINNRPMQLHGDLSPSEIFKKYMPGDTFASVTVLKSVINRGV